MQEKLSLVKPMDEPKTRKFFGVPMTENMIIGIKYLGPIVAIAALELGVGFYSEYKRTNHTAHPPATVQQQNSQSTDMPVPSYGWVEPIRNTVKSLSKGSQYTGQ